MAWQGPAKWWPTWVGICAALLHILAASLRVAHFDDTLEAGLYFYGSLTGFGTVGAVVIHRNSKKYGGGDDIVPPLAAAE